MKLSLVLLSLAALTAPVIAHDSESWLDDITPSSQPNYVTEPEAPDCPPPPVTFVSSTTATLQSSSAATQLPTSAILLVSSSSAAANVQSSVATSVESLSSAAALEVYSSSTAAAVSESSTPCEEVSDSSTAPVESSSAAVVESSSASTTAASSSGSNDVVSTSSASSAVSSSTAVLVSSSVAATQLLTLSSLTPASTANNVCTSAAFCSQTTQPTSSGQQQQQLSTGAAAATLLPTTETSVATPQPPSITGVCNSPATPVCPIIQFTQTPTNADVTFTALTTRPVTWVDVHINVLNKDAAVYPLTAPVENNNWFWNYRMTQTADRTFHFTYTTGQNGFNFNPETEKLQYFFTYDSQLVGCNTQSFVYPEEATATPPSTTTGPVCPAIDFNYQVDNNNGQYTINFNGQSTRSVQWVDVHINVLQPGQAPYPLTAAVEGNNWFWNYRMQFSGNNAFTFPLTTGPNGINYAAPQALQFFFTYSAGLHLDCNTQSFVYTPSTGVCPAIDFNYNVADNNQQYTINFNGQAQRTVQWVDVHINVLQPGQAPYPANAIVEANHWFWNYRMQSNENNAFTFPLTTGPNGINYAPPASLQFFFTYSAGLHLDCNTQSFVYNPATGALVTPSAPQPALPSSSPSTSNQPTPNQPTPTPAPCPVTVPINAQNQTFCEKYTQQLFASASSACYQTALISAIVNQAAYGGVNGVSGAFAQGQPLYSLFHSSVPYNGQTVDLSQFVQDSKLVAVVTQGVIEFFGRSFGCNAEGFPSFASNPDFVNSSYAYPDINAIRNVIKGLNLPQTFYDSINSQIVAAMKSMGVEQADIDSIVMPALNGFEQGLIGQTVNKISSRLMDDKSAAAHTQTHLTATAVVVLPVLAAILF